MNLLGIALIAAGVFTIAGGVCNWEWFMNHRKARFFCSVLGRNGARAFYVLFGVAMIVFGALMAAGVIKEGR